MPTQGISTLGVSNFDDPNSDILENVIRNIVNKNIPTEIL
jgi:hypothetical protein